ncbi:MAG: response regulator [Pseudomonadota bacterium]
MKTRKRVLLVEDDPDIRSLVSAFLSEQDHDLTTVENVPAALEALSTAPPFDLAILDFWLGSGHAVSIMDAIRSSGRALPVVIISGGNSKMDLEATEAISAISGAVVFLQKPFRKAVLLDAVATSLQQS